ncbi:hypothetical protein LY474_37315 [Myxococcus stipitatus]|uniref:hypothetical protein n=1 Tax=Myxococcus stipitatus TaxID=83455 RepID=UPI001F3A721E|nr:hypothetical protein [Myxococcus stipitatus]MCE9673482.1 hypothetical protein [Myxococcus stipitatus]
MRAGIVICLWLGMTAVASADWREGLVVSGDPRDVKAWSPGVVAYAHSTGAELHVNEVAAETRPFSLGIGMLRIPESDCFVGVRESGLLYTGGDCTLTGPGNLVPELSGSTMFKLVRVRQTPSGRGYAAVSVDANGFQLLTVAPAQLSQTPWSTVLHPVLFKATSVMGVTDTAGNVGHALVHVVGPPNLLWFREGQLEGNVNLELTPNALQTVDLIPNDGPHPLALVGNQDGIFWGQLQPPAPGTNFTDFHAATLLDGAGVNVNSLDVNTEQGSALGVGFGLAIGRRNGEAVVLGAVPAATAAEAGKVWRVHPTFAAAGLPVTDPFDQVSCADSAFCVITLRNQGQNVIYYENVHAPVFNAIPEPVELDEGALRTLDISATDGDGDALRVTAAPTSSTLVSLSTTPRPDAVSIDISAPVVCKTTLTQFSVAASDGMRTHDQQRTVDVRIVNRNGPERPLVTPSLASTTAGGAQRLFIATEAPGATCESTAYVWVSPPGQPQLVFDDDGKATFTPPANLCSASGVRYTYEVRARDEGSALSEPTSFSVDVAPWGAPSAPFSAGAVRQLTSGPGASVELRPDSLHPCDGSPGLPAVETVWRLAPGTTVPAGVRVVGADGRSVDLTSPVSALALEVEAEACSEGTLTLSAYNRMPVAGGGMQEGPASTVVVEVKPEVEQVSTASLTLTERLEAGVLEVQLGTSLRCPGAYDLHARMSVEGAGQPAQVVPVPGVWRPALPAVCSAERFTVRGELFSDVTPPVEGGRAQLEVTALARPAALGGLEGGALIARCGEGASTSLTQTIPPDACGQVTLSWVQEGGPALREPSMEGASVSVVTQDTGLQTLVGQSVTLRVTADAGQGNQATAVHTVPILAEPFVDVSHATEAPAGSDTGMVGVVVELRNTTGCDVTGLRYVEGIEGMEVVPGSVKLDGHALVEVGAPDGFTVEGVALPARGTGQLTYVARSRLLAPPRFTGQVFLNGVPVSGPLAPGPKSSGCGCSGGGPGTALVALGTLLGLLRRRRESQARR